LRVALNGNGVDEMQLIRLLTYTNPLDMAKIRSSYNMGAIQGNQVSEHGMGMGALTRDITASTGAMSQVCCRANSRLLTPHTLARGSDGTSVSLPSECAGATIFTKC
jgi:hypothetical protein